MKFLKVVIVILLLLNIATLAFVWMGKPGRHHDGPPGSEHRGDGRGPAEFLVHQLKLTDEQQEQYEGMHHRHHEMMMDLKRKAAVYRHRINDQLKINPPDSILIGKLSDSIGYCQREAEIITFRHFQDLRMICTPQQQQKFDIVINDAIDMLIR